MGEYFADQGEAAVCARVALALLRRKRRNPKWAPVTPHILIGGVTEDIRGLEFLTIRTALLSLNTAVAEGQSSARWLKDVCYRDLMQFTLRRCFYDGYKATRRSPRVTNRGARG